MTQGRSHVCCGVSAGFTFKPTLARRQWQVGFVKDLRRDKKGTQLCKVEAANSGEYFALFVTIAAALICARLRFRHFGVGGNEAISSFGVWFSLC